MGISNDAQIDVDEFGAASAELKQFPWDQKFIAWEAEARHDLEFRIGSLEQEVYALRRENADLRARAEKAEAMVAMLIEAGDDLAGFTRSATGDNGHSITLRKWHALVDRIQKEHEE